MTDQVTISARAKVNLILRVLAREADGYHGIETLFCRIDLADELTAVRSPAGVELVVEGADTGPPEDNLAVRAARLVLAATGQRFGVQLSLVKRIPVAAGLGGGSADAAAALSAVNGLAGNVIPGHELLQFAARLGADVPFCLSGAALALGWGHGDRLMALSPLPAAPALLVCPQVEVSTAQAYRWVDEQRAGAGQRRAILLDREGLGSWSSVARMAGNDFETPVFGKHPEVRSAFEALVGTGPLLCRMSGSGAALFAVYRSARDRDDARDQLGKRHGRVIPSETG